MKSMLDDCPIKDLLGFLNSGGLRKPEEKKEDKNTGGNEVSPHLGKEE